MLLQTLVPLLRFSGAWAPVVCGPGGSGPDSAIFAERGSAERGAWKEGVRDAGLGAMFFSGG